MTMHKVVGPAEAEQLLTGLLERYSPSQDEGAAVTYLVEQMKALGGSSVLRRRPWIALRAPQMRALMPNASSLKKAKPSRNSVA